MLGVLRSTVKQKNDPIRAGNPDRVGLNLDCVTHRQAMSVSSYTQAESSYTQRKTEPAGPRSVYPRVCGGTRGQI